MWQAITRKLSSNLSHAENERGHRYPTVGIRAQFFSQLRVPLPMGTSQSSLALKVDVSGKGIKDLEKDLKQPRMLPTFPKLEHINLSKNKITAVPEVIENDLSRSPKVIEYLQVLNFSKNKLTAIPDAVWLLGSFSLLFR